jgi:hypothetical protein
MHPDWEHLGEIALGGFQQQVNVVGQ